jgi:N-methylhydantoinase A
MSSTNPSHIRNAFVGEYTKRYGHSSKNVPIDLVNLRVVVTGVAEKPRMDAVKAAVPDCKPEIRSVNFDGANFIPCTIWQRDRLGIGFRIAGPAIIEESASTTLVGPSDWAAIDRLGNIHISIGSDR